MSYNPIRLRGNWEEGYAIDYHVISSVCIGENQYGRPIFETTRSMMGELVYQLKYKYKEEIVYDIIKLIMPFLNQWEVIRSVDLIIPIPPTNKNRQFQPVYLISQGVSEAIKKPMVRSLLTKVNVNQLKNIPIAEKKEVINNSIIKNKKFKKKVNILLIDDLYETGATLNEACRVLKEDENVNNIYVLVMTKTRR